MACGLKRNTGMTEVKVDVDWERRSTMPALAVSLVGGPSRIEERGWLEWRTLDRESVRNDRGGDRGAAGDLDGAAASRDPQPEAARPVSGPPVAGWRQG